MVNAIIDFFIYLNLFFTGYTFFTSPFEFNISYIPILLLLPIFISRYQFNTKTLYLIVPLLFAGIVNILLGNDSLGNFFKIFLNITINLIFYEYVMQHYQYNVRKMFKIYLKGCFVVSCYGIIQLISYKVGFEYGWNLRLLIPVNKWASIPGGLGLRINSFLSEPAYVASALGPCFFVSLYAVSRRSNEFLSRKAAWLNITCYVLSFSSLAFTGVFITLLLFALNYGLVRYLFLIAPVILFFYYLAYNNSQEFRERFTGLQKLFIEGVLDERQGEEGKKDTYVSKKEMLTRRHIINEVHGSSFILYNNFYVAKKNFARNPLLGSGLGSHEIAFEQHDLSRLIGDIYSFNGRDANSMFLRTLSEMGLMGIGFVIVFIFGYYVSRDISGGEMDRFWIISNALLIVILIQLFRQGNYTFNGFFMYGWMYYYNFVNYSEYKERRLAREQTDTKNEIAVTGSE